MAGHHDGYIPFSALSTATALAEGVGFWAAAAVVLIPRVRTAMALPMTGHCWALVNKPLVELAPAGSVESLLKEEVGVMCKKGQDFLA